MSHLNKLLQTALIIGFSAITSSAIAKGGDGAMQIGLSAGIINTEQEHMNTLISRANTRVGGITTGALNTAYEGALHFGYRFSGSIITMMLRPSFFYQTSNGIGAGNDYKYSVTGFTVFPTLRIYPLENEFMKFFMQFGIGYGRGSSSIQEGDAKIDFAGDAFGTTMGLGAEFCYANTHCLVLEGNYRYLAMERNIATSASGTFDNAGANPSLTQAEIHREVEMDNTDFRTRMSGLQFMTGYTLYF